MSPENDTSNVLAAIDPCNTQRAQVFEEITLNGQLVRIKHSSVSIDLVDFDKENPRLKFEKEMQPGKTDLQLLFEHNDTPWLKKDIEDKGVLDAIYVRETADGRYVAIEGNRRTAVQKTLHEEHPDNPRFNCIPVRILPASVTPEQEALLMASFHIAGKIRWDAHEKAGHVYHMKEKLKLPMEELQNTLHMGAPMIKRIAQSYEMLERYKAIDGGKYAAGAQGKWSFFNELLKIKEFRTRIEKKPEFVESYIRWVAEGRLPNSVDVRTLEKIMKQGGTALRLFETENADVAFEKAKVEVEKANPALNSKLFKLLEAVVKVGGSATMDDIATARDNDTARGTTIEAYDTLVRFMEQAGVRSIRRVA
jgi:hypothetical protein